jgi:hypothetical protein
MIPAQARAAAERRHRGRKSKMALEDWTRIEAEAGRCGRKSTGARQSGGGVPAIRDLQRDRVGRKRLDASSLYRDWREEAA